MALTIRLKPEEEKLVENIKHHLGEKSATQALLRSASIVLREVPQLKNDLTKARERSYRHEADLTRIKKLLHEKQTVEKGINEIINQ